MTLEDLAGELLLPFRSLSSALALLTFAALLALISVAGLFGIWLMFVVIPALFRYLVLVAEARAKGEDVEPPGIEYFTLGGHLWSLFPVVPAVSLVLLIQATAGVNPALGWFAGLVAATVFPAMIAVLVITHSPAQSLNPMALARLIVVVGPPYLLAPLAVIVLMGFSFSLEWLPPWMVGLGELYLAFVCYAVTGALIRDKRLLDAVDIPDLPGLRESAEQTEVRKQRATTLNHAYALASRGNLEGAFRHLEEWIGQDPDPDVARGWYLEQMLGWEDTLPALLFARRMLGLFLDRGEDVRAVKLMLRCRLVNDEFRPLPEDLPAAAAAARRCGNEALAKSLDGAPAELLSGL